MRASSYSWYIYILIAIHQRALFLCSVNIRQGFALLAGGVAGAVVSLKGEKRDKAWKAIITSSCTESFGCKICDARPGTSRFLRRNHGRCAMLCDTAQVRTWERERAGCAEDNPHVFRLALPFCGSCNSRKQINTSAYKTH